MAEREETLKAANLENSKYEVEIEGLMQRLRSLDESEQRYKDENWSLETQIHELLAASKEASDREQRLSQSLNFVNEEKTAAERELDELRQANGKLIEDHTTIRKNYDSELSSLRRNLNSGDSERGALQRKVDELNSQNQELAKAMAGRFRDDDVEIPQDLGSDNEDINTTQSTPEHSPPPSPVKGTPRHSVLETETIKSSLHHAHRMIQNLKSNIHREKSEKVELKRMLQEARDELEIRRGDVGGVGSGTKRQKAKAQQDHFKKPARPSRLGGERNSKTDVLVDETGWEDHSPADTPGAANASPSKHVGKNVRGTDLSDAYQTANDSEDAFDTANERATATETEAFQTGAESLAGDSSDGLTETEDGIGRGRTVRQKRPSTLTDSSFSSFMSTASDSTDDGEFAARTPVQAQPQRYRLKINRGAASRRSRVGSEPLTGSNPSSTKNSPASFISNNGGGGQSLFAELGDLNGGDSEEEADGTPSKIYSPSRTSSPSIRSDIMGKRAAKEEYIPLPKPSMVDSAMMTEPWEPTAVNPQTTALGLPVGTSPESSFAGLPQTESVSDARERSVPENRPETPRIPRTRDMGTQRTPQREENLAEDEVSLASPHPLVVGSKVAGTAGADIADAGSETRVSSIPVPAAKGSDLESSEFKGSTTPPDRPCLSLSGLQSQHIEPRNMPKPGGLSVQQLPVLPPSIPLQFSFVQSLEIRPVEPTHAPQPTKPQRMPATVVTKRPDEQIEDSQPKLPEARSNKSKIHAEPDIAEGTTSEEMGNSYTATEPAANLPFNDISAKVGQRGQSNKEILPFYNRSPITSSTDQASQTMLSSEQIDAILIDKDRKDIASGDMHQLRSSSPMKVPLGSQMIPPALRTKSVDSSTGSFGKARGRRTDSGSGTDDLASTKYFRRPSSSGSIRGDLKSRPPLPPDHREAIAAAAQKAPPSEAPPTVMGPPIAPASSYKVNRPRTPNELLQLQTTVPKSGTTPRPRFSTTRSQLSHRSSYSSFASELDERFNIRAGGMPLPYDFQGGTDPRMIQAITQTMIGEYLWKYTRKAGRGGLSDSRHRRYVWVHPYTRTLHWGERGPSAGGKAEGNSKNLPIEAVRVVTDDNPMPPGLHRKSLEIVTPERIIKLTASTGQRHETWFNAISYLLLRTSTEASGVDDEFDNIQNSTSDDIGEFNPSSGRNRRAGNARVSMSSYNSRITHNASPQRNPSSTSKRHPPPALSAQSSTNHRVQKHQPSQGSISRLSHIFKPSTIRGSFSSRTSRQSQSYPEADTVYDTPAVHDSAEDLRQVIEKQEKGADRLENVRACCDGKPSHFSRTCTVGLFLDSRC